MPHLETERVWLSETQHNKTATVCQHQRRSTRLKLMYNSDIRFYEIAR